MERKNFFLMVFVKKLNEKNLAFYNLIINGNLWRKWVPQKLPKSKKSENFEASIRSMHLHLHGCFLLLPLSSLQRGGILPSSSL